MTIIHTEISPLLGQISDSDSWLSSLMVLFRIGLAIFFFFWWIDIILLAIFSIHFFFTLPMRRAERARLFLDLVEGAIERGQSIEEMILSIAQSRDRTVGVRFHLLAAHIEGGLGLLAALEKVPRFLPPQIAAMFCAGHKLGDLKSVLPACREILRDRPAAVRSAMNYLIVVIWLFSPAFIFAVVFEVVYIVPELKQLAYGMDIQPWPVTQFVFSNTGWLVAFEAVVSLMLFFATLAYIGGPGFVRWFQFRGLPFVDWLAWHTPWKQKRLQRTFSAMLAVLLDGGVPEAEAVRLAGDCTANEICRRRSQRVIVALQQGTKLDAAVRALDDSGEFHWRLTNATHARGGFLNALRGWHEALDAKAFQQEEATAHVVTSGLVILNGLLVALIATAMFGVLMAVLNGMVFSE